MTKRIILIIALMLCSMAGMQAQKISHIEKTRSWNYVYDEKGKKVHTFSTTQGEILHAQGDNFTSMKGCWVYIWDKNGKKIKTIAADH